MKKQINFKSMLFFLVLLASVNSFAQKDISGTVTDTYGGSLPGVSVVEKGSSNGATTDSDGNYVISNVQDNAVLVFSHLGFKTFEATIGSQNTVNVSMEEDMDQLEEVVVVGYGTKKKSQLISSISTIGSKELSKVSVPNLEGALSGRLSGVFSRQTSGEPGKDGANIEIRGFGVALVVVDGIPGRNYSDLDPSEIESISVLKDAASSAVYGMQGANGVVLVTTKRGKTGKASLSLTTRYGFQEPHRMPQTASTDLWKTLMTEYRANSKLIKGQSVTAEDLAKRTYNYSTNWYDELLRNTPISQSNLNVSGGTDKIKYFFSGGFLHQEGIWNTNAVAKDRINLRSNIDVNLNDAFKVSMGFGGQINTLEYPGKSASEIARALRSASYIPVKWPEFPNEYASPTQEGGGNPVALADPNASGYNITNSRTYNIDFAIEYLKSASLFNYLLKSPVKIVATRLF